MLNLAALHEAISDAIPDHECLVFRDRRLRWRQVQDRTRRLAARLREAGLGCHTERAGLSNWESGQDHVALYLYNGNEYLEGMLGAFKARCAPFNVNYRYVDEELVYLFDNADAKAVIFHAGFAPALERVREHLPGVRLWLEVEDGSGEHLSGAVPYEEALAGAEPEAPEGLSPDDLYILYTGGTTGMPKGVLWRQEDILRSALAPPRVEPTLDAIVARATRGAGRMRALPTPPFMHGAAHWAAFSVWHVGGTVHVQDEPRHLDPAGIWAQVARERITTMTLVGDAFARPLLEALDEGDFDVSSLQTVTSGRRDPHRRGQGPAPGRTARGEDPGRARLLRERPAGAPDLAGRRQRDHGRFRPGPREPRAQRGAHRTARARLLRFRLAGADRPHAPRLLQGSRKDRRDLPRDRRRAPHGAGRSRRAARRRQRGVPGARVGHDQLGGARRSSPRRWSTR